MASPDSPWKKIGDWALESIKFSVAVVIFLFLDKVIKKPDGLPGEILVTGLVAAFSSVLGFAFLQIFMGKSCLSVTCVLDQYQAPSEVLEIDLVTRPDRGMCFQIDYAHGGLVGRYAAWRARSTSVLLKVDLAPHGRLRYAGQVVFPGTVIGSDGVTFDLRGKLRAGPVEGCEFSVSAVQPSQIPLQLQCDLSLESASGRRWPTHRLIRVECNVIGFTVRSM